MAEKKRLFQTLDDMNVHDGDHKTAFVGVCGDFVSGQTTKRGAQITMGAPAEAVTNILTGKTIPVLLLIDKEEYNKRT